MPLLGRRMSPGWVAGWVGLPLVSWWSLEVLRDSGRHRGPSSGAVADVNGSGRDGCPHSILGQSGF